jgi:hypothetical protein
MNLDLMHVTYMILSKVDSNFLFMTDLDMDYSTLGDDVGSSSTPP